MHVIDDAERHAGYEIEVEVETAELLCQNRVKLELRTQQKQVRLGENRPIYTCCRCIELRRESVNKMVIPLSRVTL